MVRFIRNLFAARTLPAAKAARRTILVVESMEDRAAPAGLGISHIGQAMMHTIQQSQQLATKLYLQSHPNVKIISMAQLQHQMQAIQSFVTSHPGVKVTPAVLNSIGIR